MTHEELIEKVAKSMFDGERGFATEMGFKNQIQPIRDRYCSYAKAAISTILTALQEPTEEMERAAFDEFEVTNPMQFKTGTLARNAIWGAMLNASPLAGGKRGAE